MLSYISLILGVISIILSVWFFVKSSELSSKTNDTLTKVDASTKRQEQLYNDYVKEIFQMFKDTHRKITDNQFEKTQDGGSGTQ
mgnify:CR=1 FL=1